MFMQKFIKIFHSVQEIGLFSIFQNLNLGNASANPKWHLTISWATSCQYQCVCKILSKYSKRFKSYRHFSRTSRLQNIHKLSGDKIKCLIIGHSMKFNFKFQLTFLGSCNKRLYHDLNPRRSKGCHCNFPISVISFTCPFSLFPLPGVFYCLEWSILSISKMSLVTRKPVFGIFDQVRLKPACSASEASYSLEISDIETRGIILSRQRTTKALIRLRGCADWSAPLLFCAVWSAPLLFA